jgi:hypothetical protein
LVRRHAAAAGARAAVRFQVGRLNVSVKLVEKHLSSAFAKLGVRSRSQLVARIAARTK